MIDQYAAHVPGGERFTLDVKQTVSGVLDSLQKHLEAEAANRLGGLGNVESPALEMGTSSRVKVVSSNHKVGRASMRPVSLLLS